MLLRKCGNTLARQHIERGNDLRSELCGSGDIVDVAVLSRFDSGQVRLHICVSQSVLLSNGSVGDAFVQQERRRLRRYGRYDRLGKRINEVCTRGRAREGDIDRTYRRAADDRAAADLLLCYLLNSQKRNTRRDRRLWCQLRCLHGGADPLRHCSFLLYPQGAGISEIDQLPSLGIISSQCSE